MRKFAILLLLLALLAGAGVWQLRQWEAQTEAQAEQVRAQAERSADFLAAEPVVWVNEAAEAALAFRPEDRAGEGLSEYVSPEDIHFVSWSEAWDEAKLRELYEELLRNRHGPELNTLERVTVYAQEDEFAAATHQNTYQLVPVELRFPLIPEGEIFSFYVKGGQISLYGGDTKTTPLEMAPSLSHEYGHHYTLTYVLPGGGSNTDFYRTYAQLRGLNADNCYVNSTSTEEYYQNHAWYLVELAAEDYVVLMGSPNAMLNIGDYVDIRGYSEDKEGDDHICRNAAPQENMFLPFAAKVPGLADFYYSFLDEPAPDYPETGDIGLKFTKHTKSYSLTTGYRSFVSYEITWDKTLGEDAVYTLVCLEPETGLRVPVITVHPDEAAKAEIGEITYATSTMVNWYTDGLAEGTKQFLVVVTLPDGRVAVSDAVEKSF